MEAGPSHSPHAHRLPRAGGLAPLEEKSAESQAQVNASAHEELSLTPASDFTTSHDETSPALRLAQTKEISAVDTDADLIMAGAAPEQRQASRRAPEKKISEPTQSRAANKTIPLIRAGHAGDQSAPAKSRPSAADFDPALAHGDHAVMRQPGPGDPTVHTGQSVFGEVAQTTTLPQNIPAAQAPLPETAGAPRTSEFASVATRVHEDASNSPEPVAEVLGEALNAVPHRQVAQVQPAREQSSPPLSKPEVTPTSVSRRRAQIQEVPAESKSRTVVAIQNQPGLSRSQPNVGNSKPPSSAAAVRAEVDSVEPQDLFARRDDADRSPAAWRERLMEAIRVTNENEKKQSAAPAAKAEPRDPHPAAGKPATRAVDRAPAPARRRINARSLPMPESARRFLSPLIGMDVRDIPIHQGPAVSRLLAASGADAMAQDDSILLGPGHEVGDVKTLPLLAHELTHIARGREARFVPPVVRETAHESSASLPDTTPDTTDEEQLARRVERRVEQATKNHVENSNAGLTMQTTRPAFLRSDASRETSGEVSPDSSDTEESWGGLPAPWDPMPEWVSAPRAAPSTRVDSAEPTMMAAASDSAAAASDASPAPALAESGRSLPEGESPKKTGSHQDPHEGKHAEPDLDALARQVYDVVRRRLAADRRREFMQ